MIVNNCGWMIRFGCHGSSALALEALPDEAKISGGHWPQHSARFNGRFAFVRATSSPWSPCPSSSLAYRRWPQGERKPRGRASG